MSPAVAPERISESASVVSPQLHTLDLDRPRLDTEAAQDVTHLLTPGHSIELLQRGESLPSQEPWASMPNQGSW